MINKNELMKKLENTVWLLLIFCLTSCNAKKDDFYYSTYIGGSESEGGYWGFGRMALDNEGNIYGIGTTSSPDFPVSEDAYDSSFDGGTDAVIYKFNQDFSKLLAATYLGGSHDERGLAIAIATTGEVYVAGSTFSTNFLENATNGFSKRDTTQSDIFIARFNSDLSVIDASLVVGGDGNEHGYKMSLVLDDNENVYINGATSSANFPTTERAYDQSFNGGQDAFLCKFNADLNSLISSTYLGGSARDGIPTDIKFDTEGNIYISGHTNSNDFPVTKNVYDTTYSNDMDIFLSKFDPDLETLLASTYFGKEMHEFSYGMTLDDQNNVFISGHVNGEYITTKGAYVEKLNEGIPDVFTIAKFSPDLTELLASTMITGLAGGQYYGSGHINCMTADSDGNIYVAGEVRNINHYPTHIGAFDETFNGGDADIVVTKLSNDLKFNLASTFIGGSERDYVSQIVVDKTGSILVSGTTKSADFPISKNSFDMSQNGEEDLFLLKINQLLQTDKMPMFSKLFEPGITKEGLNILVSNNSELVTSVDQNRRTALHWASKSGDVELTNLLVSQGVNVDALDINGHTPLHLAAIQDRFLPATIQLLAGKPNVNIADQNGNTALHLAATSGNTEMIKLLIDQTENIDAKNNKGETALHLASYFRYSDIVGILLENNANVNSIDDQAFTALHYSSLPWNNRKVQELLIKHSADLNAVNNEGQTALHLSMLNWANYRVLLEHSQNINIQDKEGKTALHYAAANKGGWFLPYFEKMIEMGLNVNIKDNNGDTSLDVATQENNETFVTLIN